MKSIIILVAIVGLLIQFKVIDNPFSPKPPFVEAYGSKVVLYATSWCGYCQKTRALLRSNHIPFKEYNIETSSKGKDEYDQLNGSGVPLLIVNGEIIRGYDPAKIIELAKDGQV
jgi:glutaredoxin